MQQIAIILLAAGASRRLGQPKQLLSYKNKTLLRHAAGCALQIAPARTLVVTGSEKEVMAGELSGLDVVVVANEHWADGLSTSISAGLSAAMNDNDALGGCLFTVCDQPYLSAAILRQILAAAARSGKGIVAGRYGNTTGTPVFFSRQYFEALLLLKGDEGAKKLLSRHADDLVAIDFPQGDIDIDTMEDYKKLIDADR